MKRLTISAVWVVGLGFAAGAFAQSGADFFPLSPESSWEYTLSQKSDSLLAGPTRREVAGFQKVGENTVFSVRNEASGQSQAYSWFRVHPDGEVVMISLSIGPDPGSSLLDFDPPPVILPARPEVGVSWDLRMTNNENVLQTMGTFRIEGRGERVTVPAGTFENCLKVKQVMFDENGEESGTIYHYYASGVGNVLTEQVLPENRRYRSELSRYSVK